MLCVCAHNVLKLDVDAWKPPNYLFVCLSLAALENSENVIDGCGWVLIFLSIIFMVATLPISIWMCIKVSCCS